MSLETDIVSRLQDHPGTLALVGDHIEPLLLTGIPPAVVYQRISTPPWLAAGWQQPRVRLSCWAPDYAGAEALAAQVRLALDHYHGALGSVHALSVVDSERDGHDPETGFYVRLLEVRVLYQEA